jgi:aspartyl-tRNA(Asn)/glutamyl-tRNA(Gln) amidotransferase subunit B
MELEPIIGLEIHVQLKTQSKMFCSCSNIFGDVEPNSAICPICMGYPGTLPVPNNQAIEWTHLVGAALMCQLAPESKFDRKSYFYPDLPKGYQISQYDKPFCEHGSLIINVYDTEKTVGITRIHLEEDAAKNTHPPGASYTLVDFNRAGTPLIEIVTEPDIRSPEEAKLFLQELQRIVRVLGVSDADIEKGQMRCDANISLREKGSDTLHPKTEIKNVNSFRFVEKALVYEIQRQTDMWKKGKKPAPATRGWNSDKGATVAQRTKEEAADYRYFPEPDIPPFVFNDEYFNTIRRQVPELPMQKRSRFMQEFGITEQQAAILSTHADLAHFFENTVSEIQQLDKEQVDISPNAVPDIVSLAANIVVRDIRRLHIPHAELKITPQNFAEMVVLLHQGKMNSSAVATVLNEMHRTGGDPDHILQNLGLEQESGEELLEQYVEAVMQENPDVVEKIRGGKEAGLQFLMGQVMAKSKGKANPKVVIELLRKKIIS